MADEGGSSAKERTEQWVQEQDSRGASGSGSRVPQQLSADACDQVSVSSNRSRGSGSRKSTMSDATKARKLAQNKLRDLEELHAFEKIKMEKEMEFLKQRLALREEIERAELNEADDEWADTESGEEHALEESDACGEESVMIQGRQSAWEVADNVSMSPDPEVTFPRLNRSSVKPPHSSVSSPPASVRCSQVSCVGSAEAQQIMSAMQVQMSLPKAEIPVFGGNPSDYIRFITTFEATVERLVRDDRVRLQYLVQHCLGEARLAIEDCLVLRDPQEGLRRAKSILARRYGRPWQLAEQYLRELTEGPVLKGADYRALGDLSLKMTKCAITFEDLGAQDEVDSAEPSERL